MKNDKIFFYDLIKLKKMHRIGYTSNFTSITFIKDPNLKNEKKSILSPYKYYNYRRLGKYLSLRETKFPIELFNIIPKLYTITANNNIPYKFNIEFLKNTSMLISELLTQDPTCLQYHLNIDDDHNVLEKFQKMYEGEEIIFKEEDLPTAKAIINDLEMQNKFDYEILDSNRKKKEVNFGLNFINYLNFIKLTQNQTFIIKTNKKEYKCSIFGVYSSKVLASLLQNDPNITTYEYDFDDELDEFQLICDIFNFKEVQITSNNMYILQEIINDLQITYLNEKIVNFIDDYEKVSQTIDDEQTIVDSIEEVFNWLYKIKELNVEIVKNYIIDSCWIQTDENVQELVAFLLQVINCDSTYHRYLLDLIIQLDKESNETNSLKILIPFIIQKLFMSFGENLLNCSFVYNLYKKGFISKEKLRNKFIDTFNEENKKGYSYFEQKTDNFIKKKNNLINWFYPEMNEIDEIASQINQTNGKPNNSFLALFFPDNPDAYERMRDNGEPDDELTKALRYDDVDTLQSIINKNGLLLENKARPSVLYSYSESNKKKLSTARVPYNIYEDFVPNGKTNYINYASAYGSLKCFKYLLLNHEKVDQSTFELAVFGGNIEIIKIVDQNIVKEPKYNNYYNKDVRERNFPSIMKHQNNIFDWIFQEKYKDKNVNDDFIYKLLLSTATNGNAHALITIIDEGYNFLSHSHEIVRLCSKNGFYLFTKLFINIFKAKKNEMILDYATSVYFGNLSIFKLYHENIKNEYNLNSALSIAIEHNYTNIIHYFFDSFVNENFITKQYVVYSCLSSAVLAKNNDLFNYLIEKFKAINPNFFNKFKKQYDLLSMSCLLGLDETDKTITNLIIENNTKTDFTTPFFNAAIAGKYEICKYFIDKKLFINYENLSSQVSKISTIKNEIFSLIIENSDPESKEVFLNTYIEEALLKNNKELAKYLIKKGASNEKSLFIAVNLHDIELLDMILEKNPSFINKRSKAGTILYIAVKNDDLKLVQHLLKVPGINPGLYESDNKTPLIAAVSNLNFEIMNEILGFYGNDIQNETKQFDEALKTVLKIFSKNNSNKPNAIQYNQVYVGYTQIKGINISFDKTKIILILKRLLEIKTIDPNCLFGDSTILSYACENNELEIVELLLQLDKIDVNLCSLLTGNSPLILSIDKNNLEIAELLIKYPRTNINIKNFEEQTALTISVSKNLDNIVNLLINNERFDPIESGINYAFFISNENLAKLLISSESLDVNYEIDKTRTEENENKNEKSYQEYKNMNLKYYKLGEKRAYVTTLIDSINNNYLEKVDLIIHHQSFNSAKSQLKRSVFASAKQNKIEIFKKLIQLYNNDVNIFNCNGESLLFVAVQNESIDIFTEILKNPSFDANKSCFLESFIEAIVKNSKSSFKIMNDMYNYDKEHDHFIDFTKLLPNGRSFFTLIASEKLFQNEGDEIDDLDFISEKNLEGVGEIATFLIENGVDPNQKDNDGFLPLEYAILLNSYDFVHALISSNKIDFSQKVEIKDDFFRLYENQYDDALIFSDSKITTYLHLAARSKNPDVFQEFINNKSIDINTTDDMDETVLITACNYNRIKNVQILSQVNDLNYLHKNVEGKDAIEIISSSIDKEIEITEIKTKDEYFAALISMLNSTNHYDKYNDGHYDDDDYDDDDDSSTYSSD